MLLIFAGPLLPAPRFTTNPTINPNPNPAVPLAAIVKFTASEAVLTTLDVSDGKNEWQLQFESVKQPAAGLPVVGMRPDRVHQIRVSIRDGAGKSATFPTVLQFKTPPLPGGKNAFPPIRVATAVKGRVEPGFTVISARKEGGQYGNLVAVDEEGVPVWYYLSGRAPSDFQKLPNGNILVMLVDQRVREIDVLGNVVAEWFAARRSEGAASGVGVDALSLHHDIEMLPSGNFVALSTDRRAVKNFFTSEEDEKAVRKDQFAMGDRLIEFTREGRIVWEWNAFDHLEPMRIGYGSLGAFWARRGFPNTVDWTHGNAILYQPADDSMLVSLRHQSSIYKIDRKSGRIVWIVGDPQGYSDAMKQKVLKPVGGMRWPYYGHTIRVSPRGTLLFFDNAVYGAIPFMKSKPPSEIYSRAVEYAIDEKAGTIREVWASEKLSRDSILGMDMGGVAWLPQKQNVLVCYGSAMVKAASPKSWSELAAERRYTAVREFTHDQTPKLVWEVVIEDDQESWASYRAEKWPRID